jgi:hypothetical protein
VQLTSSLTFKVAGVAKNIGTMFIGLALGEQVTPLQAVGYAISTAATIYYGMLRSPPKKTWE